MGVALLWTLGVQRGPDRGTKGWGRLCEGKGVGGGVTLHGMTRRNAGGRLCWDEEGEEFALLRGVKGRGPCMARQRREGAARGV